MPTVQTGDLRIGTAYVLSGMVPHLWGNAHPQFGQPYELAGVFLGCVTGTRSWCLFEIHVEGKEIGVILLSTTDMAKITITEVNGS